MYPLEDMTVGWLVPIFNASDIYDSTLYTSHILTPMHD
jgi:hypothetical protein